MSGIPNNYDEQVYAALLGKVIGVQYGAPSRAGPTNASGKPMAS